MRTLLIVLAFLFALVLQILGLVTVYPANARLTDLFSWLFGTACVTTVLLLIGNLILRYRYVHNINRMDEKSLVQYLTAHREEADKTARKKLILLQRIRKNMIVYSIGLLLLSATIAFCSGILYDSTFSTVFLWISAVIALSVFSRIRFPQSQIIFKTDKRYVPEDDYPELYALARKAAACFHCDTKIKIAILEDFNAGIAKIGDTYSLQIGAIMLNTLSQKELFSVLLHEFSHVAKDSYMSEKETNYYNWLDGNENTHFLSWLTTLFYCYADEKYTLEYSLYHYAASLINETASDQAMTNYTSPSYAASALLKTKYYDLFCYEKYTYDEVPPFAPEVLPKDILQQELSLFHVQMPKRMAFWNHLIDSEILARSASHPTLKMRLNSLGVQNFSLTESQDTDAYKKECKKALSYIEELIYQENLPTYEADRKEAYLKPK